MTARARHLTSRVASAAFLVLFVMSFDTPATAESGSRLARRAAGEESVSSGSGSIVFFVVLAVVVCGGGLVAWRGVRKRGW